MRPSGSVCLIGPSERDVRRSYSHLSWRYIRDRTRVTLDRWRNPEAPWLTSEAVSLLGRLVRDDDIGLEFGAGRSTVWLGRRVRSLISIESDPEWFLKVDTMLVQAGLRPRVDLRLIEDDNEYVGQIDGLDDRSLDLCLVDGKVRDRCALAIIPKLRSGAVLVIDNIERYLPSDTSRSPNARRRRLGPSSRSWSEFHRETVAWRAIWTSNGVFDTCLLFAP